MWVLPIFFSLVSILGAITYYIMPLTWPVIVVVALAAALGTWHLSRRSTKDEGRTTEKIVTPHWLFAGISVVVWGMLMYTLAAYSTTASIRSPWEIIPWWFFTLYFVTTLALIIYISSYHRVTFLSVVPLILFFILSFSIVLVVYRVGYGYDHIHQPPNAPF